MVGVADPVGSGLVTSLARPGANITGTSGQNADVVGKQLELIKETLPKVARVAVLWNPANAVFQALQLKATKVAAQTLGVELQILASRDADELDRAFMAMTRERPGALLVLVDPVFTIHRQRIVDFAVKRSLPAVSGLREFAEAGGLMAYGPSYPDVYRRAATYVDKILKGARPADLPVEQGTKFETVVNLRTAKALGLTIPQALLLRADEVVR
jgi:putative ABC transport system substrate-binding protein